MLLAFIQQEAALKYLHQSERVGADIGRMRSSDLASAALDLTAIMQPIVLRTTLAE
jgi:hypothetical protein